MVFIPLFKINRSYHTLLVRDGEMKLMQNA